VVYGWFLVVVHVFRCFLSDFRGFLSGLRWFWRVCNGFRVLFAWTWLVFDGFLVVVVFQWVFTGIWCFFCGFC